MHLSLVIKVISTRWFAIYYQNDAGNGKTESSVVRLDPSALQGLSRKGNSRIAPYLIEPKLLPES